MQQSLLQVKQAKRKFERLLEPPRLLGTKCSMVLSELVICLLHQQQQFPYICNNWCLLLRLEAGDILAII